MNIFEANGGDIMQHLWLYAVVTIPLMGVTFGIWYLWERREKRGQDEETGRHSLERF